jgi:NAD+ synthase (glutamine-hydrolysing)
MSMYHVNAGVPKTLVRYLIEWCAEGPFAAKAGATLRDIADTPITPELLPLNDDKSLKQRTEDTIGPYELHDFFLFHFVRHGSSGPKIQWLAEKAFTGFHREMAGGVLQTIRAESVQAQQHPGWSESRHRGAFAAR